MTEPTAPAPATGAAPTPATLIYLDVDDEITSAAARIRLAAADRVAIVLPYGSRLATSRINFRLLAREAVERGKQIEVVCADASARALALAAGLPVHASVAAFEGRGVDATSAATAGETAAVPPPDEAEDDTKTRVITTPRRSAPKVPIVGPPRPPIRTGVAVGIGLAVVLLVIVGGFLAAQLLPSATIVLHPRSAAIGPLQLTVEARPDVTAIDQQNLVIPAQRITFDVTATQTFPATGAKTIETKATGNVTFSNFDTGGANRVDAGSIVKTPSGIEFRTLADVTLPNATIEFPFTLVPSTSTVAVEAVEAGPAGNVGNNEITIVPKGENRRLLTVTNKEATSGGDSRQATEVSQADVDAAEVAIEAALLADLDAQVAAGTGVPAGVTAFPATHALGEATYTTDPATLVGTEAADFSLDATAQGTVIGVNPSPIADLVRARLVSNVTQGWTLVDSSVQPQIGTPTVAGEVVTYPVTIAGTQIHDVDQAALIEQIKGLILADARNRLAAYGDVDISLWPDWVDRVPTRNDRITFTVGEPQASAAPTPEGSGGTP
ncbi:MAG TPA: hypothetical protein VJ850_05340 [Candidatus Limnocylindrales bacterium]|nr:hypothetical protein [Candidatus Limnocylindrales bacterium]